MLSIGRLAQYFVVPFSIGFSVGTAFAGTTLGMTNSELLIMNYITQFLGYLQAPVNAWLTDNLNSRHGKFRVYIRLAVPLMFLNLISLWFPYEEIRDGVSRYAMIATLFIIGQIQGYVRSWIITGVTNMVHVMTPNAQERAKIMSITSIIYSNAPTFMNLYLPIMVDVLPVESKFTVTYFRGVHTPLALFAPLILTAFYGTQERLVLPKSRTSQMSFGNSLRSVMSNRIFWIKCFDAWNYFFENAREYENAEKAADLKAELKKAKRMPASSKAERHSRKERINEIKNRINEATVHNEEIEIAKAVMFEINRFSTDFGKRQLALARLITNAGSERFYDVYENAVELAYALSLTNTKEETAWRRQEIRNAKALKRSAKLAKKYYPDGKVFFDEKAIENAYDMPDETREQQKIRRKAMKKANKAKNIYIKVASPYLSAQRTVLLAQGYENLSEIISGYDAAVADYNSECERRKEQARLLKEEQRLDIERKRAQRRLKK